MQRDSKQFYEQIAELMTENDIPYELQQQNLCEMMNAGHFFNRLDP